MILEILSDVLAVPLLPTPSPSPEPGLPNVAEVDSARAAWAGVVVAWVSAGATLLAGGLAALAFWQQRRAFTDDRLDRARAEKRQAEMAAQQVYLTCDKAHVWSVSDSGPHQGEMRIRYDLQLVNGGGTSIKNVQLVAPLPVDAAFRVVTGIKPGLALEHRGHRIDMLSVPANSSRQVSFVSVIDEQSEGQARLMKAVPEQFLKLVWSDFDGRVWVRGEHEAEEVDQAGERDLLEGDGPL